MKPGLRWLAQSTSSFSMHRVLLVVLLVAPFTGCLHVKLDPIEVNANVNVNVKLEKALNDFFGDLDKKSTTVESPAKS